MRSMTKSPLAFAKEAFRVGQSQLDPYSCARSRKDFTQPQLFALLALRQFFQADYRKTIEFVAEWAELQGVLQLKKIPHFTTIQKAHQRLLKKGSLIDSSISSLIEPDAAA